jgi:hypothetical protein
VEEFGVFVSPLGSDADGDGSRERPFATLAKALGQAKAQQKRVYACSTGGAFEESVVLDGSLDKSALFGGFDCTDWSYAAARPTEALSSGTVALKVSGVKSLWIEDFAFTAADASEPGGSSVGAWIHGSAGVLLRRVELKAGRGADGANGVGTTAAAVPGAPGQPGVRACVVETAPNAGAPAVESICDEAPSGSVGGKGGSGGVGADSAGNGNAGRPALSSGAPGIGQVDAAWNCDVGAGRSGANGSSPPTAKGGVGPGILTELGFEGAPGAEGANGTPGQGGGGGGGALAPMDCGARPLTGASGGSGGGGGCGGKGGTGGQGGGGSFALVSVHSAVTLEKTTLLSDAGGNGGKGGRGQPGGTGGPRGEGASDTNTASYSCSGGDGGHGGTGAPGGGGAGGPSVGIAFIGSAPTRMGAPNFQLPENGALGGLDGRGLALGAGAIGAISEALEY